MRNDDVADAQCSRARPPAQDGRSGRLPRREIFFSLAFLGLCHSLFEDSLLLALIGGHLPGLVLGRLLFALGVVAVLVRVTRKLSDRGFARLLLLPLPAEEE